jgi:hypothetical protein
MEKIAEYRISRFKAAVFALVIGVIIGAINTLFRPIDFDLTFSFYAQLIGAVIAVVFLHEGIHGLTAFILGAKPVFGIKPPLVYTTFKEKIPRLSFILIALAPLVILDILFGLLFAFSILKVFSYFCLIINTIGAVGDIWIFVKLIRHNRNTMIQDTKSGIEIWQMTND